MMPSGPPTPVGGAQSVATPSMLRTNSGLMGEVGQAVSIQAQTPFSLVSPRNQFNSNSLLGNMSNVSSLLNNHSFGNGATGSGGIGLSGPSMNLQQRGGGGLVGAAADMVGGGGAEQDPLAFASSSGPAQGQHFHNPSGNQLGSDQGHPQSQQLEAVQNFQQQFTVPQHQQQQLQGGLGNTGSVGPVKLEPQLGSGEQNGPQQQLQAMHGVGPVKTELQHPQSLRGLGPVKMEPEHSEQSMFLRRQQQQQQQQQQFLQLSRQNSQAAAAQLNILQHQRNLQMQQQQHQQQQHQQHILKNLPQQRTQLQQQLHQNSLPVRTQAKPSTYEPGTCARRLTQYMYHQQHRPVDNNIEFWRKFIAEFFAPNAKKRLCVSLYGSGRQTTGVFPQDIWHCEICNRKPVRGFETTVEVLPRLCQIKYASGTLEELLYVDMPHEYHNASGQIVLDYAKAIQESVFEQLRVVRDGQLRIVFNPDLKICSWEFCAKHHEELIPRRLLIPQVSQLGAVVQRYQAAVQNASSGLSAQDLRNSCNSFVASARQLAKALEVPLVNDLGYTKRYVRCLQISEVVNSMKDLIDYSRETGTGPIDSLNKFPRRTSASSGASVQQVQQHEGQRPMSQNASHNNQGSVHATMQFPAASNGVVSINNPLNPASSTSTPTVAALLHQNSMNSRQENQMSALNSPYCDGNTAQIPSTSPSSSLPPPHLNPSSPFPSPTLSGSSNPMPNSQNNHLNTTIPPANTSSMQQSTTQSQEAEPNDSQSTVQQILQSMMSSQHNGVSGLGNQMKGINGITPAINGGNRLTGNGIATSSSSPVISGMGFGSMGGLGASATVSGIRGAMTNNGMAMNGRVGINSISQDPTGMNHQQLRDMGNRLLGGFGTANGFNNLQFDWKSSP